MTDHPGRIEWGAINSVPEGPGVYAWYYNPRFTRHDRLALETTLASDPSAQNIENFIAKHLFKYFEEAPYEVTIRGPLKAAYSGNVFEERSVTPELSQRLAEDADRRAILWNAIEMMVPFFAAPLYIGMAKNLRTRLRRHKSLIEGGLEKLRFDPARDQTYRKDAGFASEVLRRRLAIERLSVYILELPVGARETAADVENLLNRINYPVLGRN